MTYEEICKRMHELDKRQAILFMEKRDLGNVNNLKIEILEEEIQFLEELRAEIEDKKEK